MGALTRTNQGRLEAFNALSALPDDLRLLLKFIDGKRDQQDLQRALKNDICSPANLQKLLDQGLVQEASHGHRKEENAGPQPHAYLPTLPAGLSPIQPLHVDAQHIRSTRDDNAAIINDALLTQVKSEMETFLLTHAPQVALQVLGDIERLTSLGQLEASLGSYQQMISATGILGMTHLRQVRARLNEHVSRDSVHGRAL